MSEQGSETTDRAALIARAEEMVEEGLYDFELVKLLATALSEADRELGEARADAASWKSTHHWSR